jgi:hypothetical protein
MLARRFGAYDDQVRPERDLEGEHPRHVNPAIRALFRGVMRWPGSST